MIEQDVTIRSGDVRLAGSLTLPDGRKPLAVALFLHGTGPLDRDENIPRHGLNVFNVIAARLAQQGIASLRYDKRGCGRSGGDYYAAGQDDLLDDAQACLDYLDHGEHGVLGPRFLIGHSEGTVLAARLSLKRPVQGLALLAPLFSPVETALANQAVHAEKMLRDMKGPGGLAARLFMAVMGSPVAQQPRIIARLRTSTAPSLWIMGQKVAARSLRDLLELDIEAVYRKVSTPMLVLGGTKDLQCDPQDVMRIAGLAGDLASPVLVDDLTHILRRDAEPASLGAYRRLLREPIDDEVVGIVANWIESRAA